MSNDPGQHSNPDGPNLIANRYRLGKQLGKGTFGVVFLAEDIKFQPPRAVAIKILHAKFLNEPEVRADIQQEASVLARFSHPNILRVIDFDISENQAFIVTELAEGGSLARKIRPDPNRPSVRMPLADVARYLEQICEALDEAHTAGLIHRDLKPLNILLDRRNRPLVADFGLATALSTSQSSVLVDATTSGTPPYMAPEQWMGHAGKASDIYAIGIITYQMITGEWPYQGGQFELMGQHMQAPVPKLSVRAPDLQYPPALDDVIAQVLAKEPRQRFRSASEFYQRFREALAGNSPGLMMERAAGPIPPKNDLPPTGAIPGPAYYPATQPQVPANPLTNPAFNPQFGATQVSSPQPNPPGNPALAPTQAALPLVNRPPEPQYAQTQFASQSPAQANGNYDRTQVAQSQPPNAAFPGQPQTPANFNANGAHAVPVRTSRKNLPLIIGAAAVVTILVVGGLLFALSGKNNSTPVAGSVPTLTPAPATTAPIATSAAATTAPIAVAATATSAPTANTPQPTNTTAPTATRAPEPTATPTPAATSTPAPTATPLPLAVQFTSAKSLKTLSGSKDQIYSIAYSPDGKTIAAAINLQGVVIWDTTSGSLINTFTYPSLGIRLAYSPDGKTIAVSGINVNILNASSGKLISTFAKGDNGSINSVNFSPDGKTLATTTFSPAFKLWDVASGKLISTFDNKEGVLNQAVFSPDGKTIAAGGDAQNVALWDVASGKQLQQLTGHVGPIEAIAFSKDGKTLASASYDQSIKLWDVAGGKLLKTFSGHSDGVNSVTFSQDGKTLVSASTDKTIKLWDVASGKALSTLTGHSDSVNVVTLGPNGRTFASGSNDTNIIIWQVSP